MRTLWLVLLFLVVACGEDRLPTQVTNDHFEYLGLRFEIKRGEYIFTDKIMNNSGVNIGMAWFEIVLYDIEKSVQFNRFRFSVSDFMDGQTRRFRQTLDMKEGNLTGIQFGIAYILY